MNTTTAKLITTVALAAGLVLAASGSARAADGEMPITFSNEGGDGAWTTIGGNAISAEGITISLPTTLCSTWVNHDFNPAAVTRQLEVRGPSIESDHFLASTITRWTTHVVRSPVGADTWTEYGTGSAEGVDRPEAEAITMTPIHKYSYPTLYFVVPNDPVGTYEYRSWQQIDFLDEVGNVMVAGVPFADGALQSDLFQFSDPHSELSFHGNTSASFPGICGF